MSDIERFKPSDSEDDEVNTSFFNTQSSGETARVKKDDTDEEVDVESTEVDGTDAVFDESVDTEDERDKTWPKCECRDDMQTLMDYFMDKDFRRSFFKKVDYFATHKPAKMRVIARKPLKLAHVILHGEQ